MSSFPSVILCSAVALCASRLASQAAPEAIFQQAYLKASNTGADDNFGHAVAVSGDTVVVGAYGEDSRSVGVDGDQDNDLFKSSGAAYVFVRDGANWIQQAYLKASNTGAFDEFGYSVAISGDTIVVGAFAESSSATGVDGDQEDNRATEAGAAYVFVREGTTWTQQAYLKASNTEEVDNFGFAVAVSGDTIVVGAPGEDSNVFGVDGDQGNNDASIAGAAYVFVREGATWAQQAYLKASNAETLDAFGESVAVSGNTIVVAAEGEDSDAAGVNGIQHSNALEASGAAYVFVRNGTAWSQQAYLKASNPDAHDRFADALAVSGDTLVIGAVQEMSNATGVNGDQSDNSVTQAGAAYVFVRSGTQWSQQAYLKASNTPTYAKWFGHAVAVVGDTVVIGAPNEDGVATGVNGDQNSTSSTNSGAAYLFVRNGPTWSQQAYLKASNTGNFDGFGSAVGLSGNVLAITSQYEKSSATGVDGNQNDNGLLSAGAGYVFDITWIDVGFGLAGVSGVPHLGGAGPLTPGSVGALMLSQAKPAAPALLLASLLSVPVPFKGGTMAANPSFLALPLLTDGTGSSLLSWPSWPTGVPPSLSLYLQCAIQDRVGPSGVSLSNAIRGTTP